MGIVGSCLGSCVAQCGCACISKACGNCRSKGGSFVPYMVLFILSTILALVLRYWGQDLLINLYVYHLDLCSSEKCLGVGGVNRISFALFVFFFLHAILIKFVGSCSRMDSQSWWTKLLVFIIFLVGAWFIPNDFYGVYMHISRVVSGFFLLLQLIILIDFGYQWNESWTSDEKKSWGEKAILVISILMYLGSLAFFICDLIFFGGSGCHLEKFFIAFTFVLTFILSAISVSPWIENGGGILPAAVVTLYSYWLLFTALTSDPTTCNSVSSRSREFAPLVIGLLLTACSVTYASWTVATNTEIFEDDKQALNPGDEDDDGSDLSKSKSGSASSVVADRDDDDDDSVSAASTENARLSARFHMLMACASMYVSMLLSGWGSQTGIEGNDNVDLDWANVWIKISTQWVCIGLFIWTLIAPIVCRNRDFS